MYLFYHNNAFNSFIYMINNQIMKRPFYTGELLQRTQDGYFNANSLIEIYNSSTKSNSFTG
jgi:hypothetical protein